MIGNDRRVADLPARLNPRSTLKCTSPKNESCCIDGPISADPRRSTEERASVMPGVDGPRVAGDGSDTPLTSRLGRH